MIKKKHPINKILESNFLKKEEKKTLIRLNLPKKSILYTDETGLITDNEEFDKNKDKNFLDDWDEDVKENENKN
jgi:hypothetical protein